MSGSTSEPRIVVGVDGSDPSKAAVRWAARQAALTGGVVDAVTAWEYPVWYGAGFALSGVDFAGQAADVLARTVADALGADRTDGIRARVVQGHPARVLLDAADGAQLLVVGNRGHGGFTEALLGSVSQHLVQHATCPVVVIRGEGGAPAG